MPVSKIESIKNKNIFLGYGKNHRSTVLQNGPIDMTEMLQTFNMGIGMIAVVDKIFKNDAISILSSCGENAFEIGEVVEHSGSERCKIKI